MRCALLTGTLLGVITVWGRADEPVKPAEPVVPSRSPADLAAWLDATFEGRWKQDGAAPDFVDDATFLRRVYLDIVGTIPTVAQARDFLDDTAERKREYLVDKLLIDARAAPHMARVWRRIMVPGNSPQANFAAGFEPWLQKEFQDNTPYDEFARKVLTAKGDEQGASPMVYYQAVGGTPDSLASSMTRVFLGVRIGCAKCHNHPFAEWKQEDFWGMAAFFAGAASQPGNPRANITDTKLAKIKSDTGDKEFEARFLWGETPKIPEDKFPRQVLADWVTSKSNPNFAATAVNRVWQQLCGQGLIPHVDDMDQARPQDRAIVLDKLAGHFVEAKFDFKWLIGGICRSRVYQRVSSFQPTDDQAALAEVTPLSARRTLKTLAPEQVFDSLEQALMLPISKGDDSPRHNGQRMQVIARLNEAYGDSPDQFKAGIPQALLLMNGALIAKATDLDESRTLRAVVDAPFLKPEEKIETLYLAAFTRSPTQDEMQELLLHIEAQKKDEQGKAYGEIFWALVNSPEFVLCR